MAVTHRRLTHNCCSIAAPSHLLHAICGASRTGRRNREWCRAFEPAPLP